MGIISASRDIGKVFDEWKGGTMVSRAAAGGLWRTSSEVDVGIGSATSYLLPRGLNGYDSRLSRSRILKLALVAVAVVVGAPS